MALKKAAVDLKVLPCLSFHSLPSLRRRLAWAGRWEEGTAHVFQGFQIQTPLWPHSTKEENMLIYCFLHSCCVLPSSTETIRRDFKPRMLQPAWLFPISCPGSFSCLTIRSFICSQGKVQLAWHQSLAGGGGVSWASSQYLEGAAMSLF